MKHLFSFILALFFFSFSNAQHWQFVDPRIGSVGVGRTFPGPCMPFGMAKPGPDCTVTPNAGWAPLPEVVNGFSQTHVSGTGGGQKYGNVLIMPFAAADAETALTTAVIPQRRQWERIALGYYATAFQNGIQTEITTDERCAFYRFHYQAVEDAAVRGLYIDLTHFLGKDTVPDLRERQQFVGAGLEVVSDREVRGFTRVRGGWNNGDAYTVCFSLRADQPFTARTDEAEQRAWLAFADTLVTLRVGISAASTHNARRHMPDRTFDEQLAHLRQTWEGYLCKADITGSDRQKRMFYSALYHTLLMPVDKTGDNPKWTDSPYYDDYYAIWDTYRTSSPLITLLWPDREVAIVNSLLNIYAREGFMPDARSGDCNGRTQGGSNADVMIADAMAKQLQGIDYQRALEAMLKDAEQDPGADHERHGRGGLTDYIRLGYIPYGTDRAGNRTVEYAFNDWCVAEVARRLGRHELYERYSARSHNWQNLWRSDYEWEGTRGFIMPRDARGCWLDSVVWGRSDVFQPKIAFTPVTRGTPWYMPWWGTFFYEASSHEYSLSMPHDVEALIGLCGGAEAFRKRLDRFFARGYYNVANEPSFLTPCLYHWIGRPDLSTDRVRSIVEANYSDAPDGLPGNDDSGAMSSWLAFHLLGLYPNAGTDYYLLNLPMVTSYTLQLPNGRKLSVRRTGKGTTFGSASLNGRPLTMARITHAELLEGGQLVFVAAASEAPTLAEEPVKPTVAKAAPSPWTAGMKPIGHAAFTLNRQFRTWPLGYQWQQDTLLLACNQTLYRIPRSVVEQADGFSWLSPQGEQACYDSVDGTFLFLSRQALDALVRQGQCRYNGITWRTTANDGLTLTARADIDGAEMQVSLTDELPWVLRMTGNRLDIDWRLEGM